MLGFGNPETPQENTTPIEPVATGTVLGENADQSADLENANVSGAETPSEPEVGTVDQSADVEATPKVLINKVDGNAYEVLSEQDMGDHVMVSTSAFGVRFEKTEEGTTSDTWELKDQE